MIRLRTFSGRVLDLEHPDPSLLRLGDVAVGLSNCCRFAGQLPQFYSVAQHAAFVSTLVDPFKPWLQLAALHHDDSEAFLGDVSRNLKRSPFMFGYRVLEKRLEEAIAQAQHLPQISSVEHEHLKAADNLAARFEHVVLRTERLWTHAEIARGIEEEEFIPGPAEGYEEMTRRVLPDFTTLLCWEPGEARQEFIRLDARYRERMCGRP